MKKWEIIKEYTGDLMDILLENRGVATKKEKNVFLNPPDPATLTSKDVGIDKVSVTKAIKRIQNAIKDKESIVVYADYDADGITAGAIISSPWITASPLGKK
ncbi:MAG: Single-stranded-DNA-specific exonuclease recJ [Candidatus Gottesmanbacteria bacterium GW2011_GWA2_44_17]|uniref:Single-stranded-DNA-specific exonuclease recJ n=1 Tax=Candidatus Gottesmanbacteria bacterium GW2011_GWA2_44_17 TaxID=1618444 RepID=A0A0G1HFF4_9BACT|nr:MAG: Single-stranded-DNA-specific exonuclease recJ [Candidatus Gottesmanbacteria bacterium GW2011_GWA2_44_17]